MNSNKIIQSLWIGTNLTNIERLCINSYLSNGHDFHLYIYKPVENIPHGATIMDANEIVPGSKIFIDSRGSYASFADYFRYKMLYYKGGWWVDMDTICLKYFDFQEEYCFSSEFDMSKNAVINIGYLKTPQGAEILKDCIDYIDSKLLTNDNESIQWGTFGIPLFSTILRYYDAKSFIKPPVVFCPISYYELSQLISKRRNSLTTETYAIHMWNEIWKQGYLDKNADYHPNSLFEYFKGIYLSQDE